MLIVSPHPYVKLLDGPALAIEQGKRMPTTLGGPQKTTGDAATGGGCYQ
jgi:hypothetical protein